MQWSEWMSWKNSSSSCIPVSFASVIEKPTDRLERLSVHSNRVCSTNCWPDKSESEAVPDHPIGSCITIWTVKIGVVSIRRISFRWIDSSSLHGSTSEPAAFGRGLVFVGTCVARLIRWSVGMSGVLREPRFYCFGRPASKAVPAHGDGAPDTSPAACLFLYQRNRQQRKFAALCTLLDRYADRGSSIESGSLRRPIAKPGGLASASKFERSSLGLFRAPWKGSKNPLHSSLPPSVPQRGNLLLFSDATKGAKTHPLSLT